MGSRTIDYQNAGSRDRIKYESVLIPDSDSFDFRKECRSGCRPEMKDGRDRPQYGDEDVVIMMEWVVVEEEK